jgi:hypothetical protein
MKFDKDKVDDYTLAMLYLVMWEEKHSGPRAWKSFDWDTMDRLREKGYIFDPKSKSKSVAVTEKGFLIAQELFIKYFGEDDE